MKNANRRSGTPAPNPSSTTTEEGHGVNRITPVVPETRSRLNKTPRPFLKWAGGKGNLLPELIPRVEAARPFSRYHEPFVGGGALFFELHRCGWLGDSPPVLSDSNINLIKTYQGLQQDAEAVIERLEYHAARHDKDYYYAVRAEQPEDLAAHSARIIYLNRTCYNGLYRENSRGRFNVPMGRYTNPTICSPDNLRAVAKALRAAELQCEPFTAVLERAQPGDFVYCDPPYNPVSKTASFTAYTKGGFGEDAQRALAETVAALKDKGVRVLVSNSKTPLIEAIYRVCGTIETVYAARAVNSNAARRGKAAEVLVRTY